MQWFIDDEWINKMWYTYCQIWVLLLVTYKINSILTNVGRKKRCLSLECWWDFSGGPTIKTSRFHYKGHGVDPWLENKDPMCCMAWPKGKKSECWQSWGDLELSISPFSWDKLINPILLRQVLGIVLATVSTAQDGAAHIMATVWLSCS